MIIKLRTVRFVDDVLIPRWGEKKGLSQLRVRGGNEAPVDHELTYDTETQLVTIRHLRSTELAEPTVYVPLASVRWMQEELDEPSPPVVETPPAPTAPETPKSKPRPAAAGKIVVDPEDDS